MAQNLRQFRGNLTAAQFPLITNFQGRTVIVPQFDQNANRGLQTQSDPDKDVGIPQILFMENCMPIAQGVQSIGFDQIIPAEATGQTDFDSAFLIRDSNENRALFVPALGKNYIATGNTFEWESVNPLTPGVFPSNGLVSVAAIHQRTLIFYENIGCFEYNFTTNTINTVPLGGLTVTAIKGICSAVGYLIAYDDSTLYWSSTDVETDFVPDLVTGAGSEIPNDLKGKIVCVLPITNGFIIYTEQNAVAGTYSGNVRFPWVFKEISNSAGVTTPEDITWNANLNFHYVFTLKGLMRVDRVSAEPVFPEVTDFLAAKVIESYDSTTFTLTTTKTTAQLKSKVSFIGSRYLVISYGVTNVFTNALLYDGALKRWGKMRIDHVDCFEWPAPNFFGTKTYDDLIGTTYDDLIGTPYDQLSTQQANTGRPKHDIAFLHYDGTVKIANFDYMGASQSGTLIVGKYQFVRNKNLVLLGLDLETIQNASTSTLVFKVLSSFNGKTFELVTIPYLLTPDAADAMLSYLMKIEALNHSFLWQGGFYLVSFEVDFIIGGFK